VQLRALLVGGEASLPRAMQDRAVGDGSRWLLHAFGVAAASWPLLTRGGRVAGAELVAVFRGD